MLASKLLGTKRPSSRPLTAAAVSLMSQYSGSAHRSTASSILLEVLIPSAPLRRRGCVPYRTGVATSLLHRTNDNLGGPSPSLRHYSRDMRTLVLSAQRASALPAPPPRTRRASSPNPQCATVARSGRRVF